MKTGIAGVDTLIKNLASTIIDPILALIFAIGLVVFAWGVVEYLWNLSNDLDKKKEGKEHMLWGIIGMFVMASAAAIIHIIQDTVTGFLQ